MTGYLDKVTRPLVLILTKMNGYVKSNSNIKCLVCHYWLFSQRFKFQDYVCNGGQDLAI